MKDIDFERQSEVYRTALGWRSVPTPIRFAAAFPVPVDPPAPRVVQLRDVVDAFYEIGYHPVVDDRFDLDTSIQFGPTKYEFGAAHKGR